MEKEFDIKIKIRETAEGEPLVEFRNEQGQLMGFIVGEGDNLRGVVFETNVLPEKAIAHGWAASGRGMERLRREMKAGGAVSLGRDSPDLERDL